MSLALVENALRSAVATVLGTTFTEWENTRVVRSDGCKRWAQVFYRPGRRYRVSCGDDGLDRVDGYLQVTMKYATGTGTKDATDDYESFASVFSTGSEFTSGEQVVTVTDCSRDKGPSLADWYSVYFTIYWYAYIPK